MAYAGDPCPQTGRWQAPRLKNQIETIERGQPMPGPTSTETGTVVWYLMDGNRNETPSSLPVPVMPSLASPIPAPLQPADPPLVCLSGAIVPRDGLWKMTVGSAYPFANYTNKHAPERMTQGQRFSRINVEDEWEHTIRFTWIGP